MICAPILPLSPLHPVRGLNQVVLQRCRMSACLGIKNSQASPSAVNPWCSHTATAMTSHAALPRIRRVRAAPSSKRCSCVLPTPQSFLRRHIRSQHHDRSHFKMRVQMGSFYCSAFFQGGHRVYFTGNPKIIVSCIAYIRHARLVSASQRCGCATSTKRAEQQ